VAVQDGAHVSSRGHGRRDLVHDLAVRLAARLRLAVEPVERTRPRVERFDPERGNRICDEVEDLVCGLDRRARSRRQMRGDVDAGADDRERAVPARALGWLRYR
jgi:hypothetical protein